MKKMNRIMSAAVAGVMVISMGAVAFADSIMTPAQTYSNVTGKTVEEAYEQRSTGKTYGELAKEEGKYEEFKQANLESRKQLLEQRVEDGKLTEDQADAILQRMQDCDGESMGHEGLGFGRQARGSQSGAGFKRGSANAQGNGMGGCQGAGIGAGQVQEK